MNRLTLSENIIKLRHKKGVTQDELATFLNVTKASVSKWETRLSYPDILLLPQIAAYFDVSIDDLLGYEPQMSPEQIKKCYLDLANDFAKLPYDEVMEKSESIVREYYACYPLLIQIAVLWLNHYVLTKDTEKQKQKLNDIIELCDHIYKGSKDVGLSSNAAVIKAVVNLTLGNAKEVIEEIEPLSEAKQLIYQTDPVLIQAYRMTGDTSRAILHSQISIYRNLMALITSSIGIINLDIKNEKLCEETIYRTGKIIDTYDLTHLHPNITLQYHYVLAAFYCIHDASDKALEELELFVSGSLSFIEKGLSLHGDDYFDRIEEWFDAFALKTEAPRNEKIVLESLIPAMENPVFSPLYDTGKYKALIKRIELKIKDM